MDLGLGVRGTPTPRAQQRQLPSSARRPVSARQNRNPITGEDYPIKSARPAQNTGASNSRPESVPSLNLKYLKENDEPMSGPLDVSLRDYKLDTPDTASTVSWGTSPSGFPIQRTQKQTTSVRPSDVPSLSLGMGERLPSARKIPKEPSAWDKMPVPEDLPAPSARHQAMYRQYTEEMKQGYRQHSHSNNVTEEDISKAIFELKKARQTPQTHPDNNQNNNGEMWSDADDDVVDEQWKKQRYTANQMRKKLDAEELLEYNKKQKAVISDPEQNERDRFGGSTTRRARGTQRSLHASKVSTRSTATENLLSRRMRFGARIITRNGRDAVRELTGFFFQLDRTLTVYEFKQFGKSAKAIPFIQRGVFHHLKGPKMGLPYSLSDIFTGADLMISTEGQHALSAELARSKYITLRVTDVDEQEKAELLENTDRPDAPSRLEYENLLFLASVQDAAQAQIRKRGIKTITGLGRHYRQLDKTGTGDLEQVFDIIDPEGERRLDYSVFMRTVLGEMNEFRKALVRKAFIKVDTHKQGTIYVSDIRKFFNVNCPYKPGSDADSTKNALQAFLAAVRASNKQEEVTFIEFEEYYEGLSLGVDDDKDFANILRNTWSI
ncbi:hypothetical protein BaRGS_00005751 [Batillaria attramentaria]|uniref:Calcyphosin-2 PH domain-containing protein n=1 Tax=Batillaria attramentaria TaxID=370345 RepID=A0ABD0LUB2_9CAEN